jgi:predicted acylesterase/phospholipase RssA
MLELELCNIIKIIDINTLVISGGSMKGYLFIGTIKLLTEYGILDKIKYFYGTSFGSILITLIVLGWNTNEIIKFLVNFPINSIIDFNIDKFLNNYGLISQNNFEILFKKIIEYKGLKSTITFRELFIHTGKELNLMTFDLKCSSALMLNHINTPNLMIWEGLHMSSALPILSSPYSTMNSFFIDGGITENFPINRVKLENINKTIGICIDIYHPNWNLIKSKLLNKDFIKYLEYSFELIKILFAKTNNNSTKTCFNLKFETICDEQTSINFSLNSEAKLQIINEGYIQSGVQFKSIIETLLTNQLSDNKLKKSNTKYHEI